MKYTKDWLIKKVENEEKVKYLFFWGHTPSKDGSITKTCFSQWWVIDFVVDDIVYPTAEHWLMAEKARLFKDEEALARIIRCLSPAEAKKIGREVKNFDPGVWDQNKFEMVKTGNYHKFSQNAALRDFLVNTQDRVIVEASPRDQIWGIGMSEKHENAENPALWRGQNLLGFALMEVREMFEPSSKP